MSLVKRSMVMSVFLAAAVLTPAMVAAAVGCGGEGGTPTRPRRPAATPADVASTSSLRVPTPTVGVFSTLVNPIWSVPPALEEQIFTSTVIARASLLSVSAAVEEVESGPGVAPTYHAIQELSFTVHEYLKGSGPPELVVVRSGHNHLSGEDALEVAEYRVSTRNTTWDDREGLLFLRELRPAYEASTGSSGGNSTRSAHQTLAFTQSNYVVQSEWDYTVDTLSRAWLPAGQPGGSSGNAGRSDSRDSGGYIMDHGQSPPETVSLAEVKRQVAEMEARVAAGAGVPGFKDCMHYKIIGDRHLRARPWTPQEVAVDIPSGSAAGTEIYRKSDTDGEPKYNRYWLSGPDAGMFEALRVDDDTIPRNGYEHMLATARPLPGGEYVVLYNRQLYVYFPCNFVPDDTYIEWTVTVTPPLDTVHEAFFDPVADGAAVGYTAGAGRLEPAAFDFDGTTIEITDLHWDEGSVSLTVDPPGGLTDFALEFIALDGTTSRRLSGSAATEDAGTGAITWQVSVPIWEDGDLVLLRISEGGGDPSPAPAEEPTATPEPTETPTPEPGPQEDEAWLEPDPEGATLDGQWREFTVRAPGVRRPEVAFNVIGYGGAPTSTGAVALSAADTPPDAGEACESASYGSLRITEGGTFWLVGCEAGTVVIEILDPCNGRALLKRYSVAVSGGP